MEERLSKAQILQRLQAEYWRLKLTLAGLTPAQMLQPNVVGTWSVKEVVAHLVFWNRLPVRELEAAQRGETLEFEHGDTDEMNALAVALYAERSLETALTDFDQSYQVVVQAIQSLPDTAFEPDNPLEQILGETIAGTFGNNTYDHYPLHEVQLREWLVSQKTRTVTWQDPAIGARAATMMSGLDYMRAMLRGEIPPPPISFTLGFTLLEVDKGYAVFGCQPAEYHYNPIGVVHGGLAALLLDSALGCCVHTALPLGSGYTTVELNVNLVRAITSSTGYLRCEAKVIHIGRQLATAEARLTDDMGKLYAHGTTTCLVFTPNVS